MKQFIKEQLIKMHKTVSVDKWGQVHQRNYTPGIFGDKKEEVEQYCKTNPNILKYSTYGGRFGNYRGFTVEDDGLKKVCSETLRENENYINSGKTIW